MSYARLFSRYVPLLCFVAAAVFVLNACSYTTGVVQSDKRSFIRFSGNIEKAVVYIDDAEPFELGKKSSSTHSDNIGAKNLSISYQLQPGKHTVVVRRNGEVVVNRELLLGNNVTTEVEVP